LAMDNGRFNRPPTTPAPPLPLSLLMDFHLSKWYFNERRIHD
jgi:hypothetical protein